MLNESRSSTSFTRFYDVRARFLSVIPSFIANGSVAAIGSSGE